MKAARAGAIYVTANLLSAGVPFLLLPLLTRVLTPAEYGLVVNYFLLVSACSCVAGLSVHGAVSVAWFDGDRNRLPSFLGSAVTIAAISSTLVAVAVYGILRFSGQAWDIPPAWGALAAVAAGSQVLLQCRLVLWQSQKRPIPVAVVQVAASVLNVSLSLIAVLLLQWGGEGRSAAAAASSFVMALVAVLLLWREPTLRLSLERRDVGRLIGFGVPMIPHAFAGVLLSTADRFVVSTRLGSEPLGIYGAGAQLGAVMAILADAFVKAFNPWLFERLSARSESSLREATGAMYLAVPAFLALGVVVGGALTVASGMFLGEAYRSVVGILPWFMVGGSFAGMYSAVSGLYFFFHRTALLSSISVPAGIAGVIATVLLTRDFGLQGAAAGYALTQGLLALGAWVVAFKVFQLPWRPFNDAVAAWKLGLLPRSDDGT